MDELLKLAGDAGYEISCAEEALDEDAHDAARDALDRAADHLTELRGRWPDMSAPERAIVGPAAKVVRDRLDAVAARVPARRTLSEGAAEADPEEDAEPDGTTGP
jgi:hypothetical protein